MAGEELDFANQESEIRRKVFTLPPALYGEWRTRHRGLANALKETPEAPPEKLLQLIWLHQRLKREGLHLLDGRPIQILHPGFWNHGAGPDFQRAVVRLGDSGVMTCDVEIDVQSGGWHTHAHHRNPAFAQVALHVVWRGDGQPTLPTLELAAAIDAPIGELADWLSSEAADDFPPHLIGACSGALRALAPSLVRQLLRQAALIRLHRKAHDLEARARQAGWEQALWEGLLRALGYKQNAWAMQRLGELRPKLQAPESVIHWQARLLGVGNLLPTELPRRPKPAGYLQSVWDVWWRERQEFTEVTLPRSLWRFNGVRPANRPERRLALAAHWFAEGSLPRRIEEWFTRRIGKGELAPSLATILQAGQDEFWCRHWTLNSAPLNAPQPLLGQTRVTDLAMNVILPWLWVRARNSNPALRAEAETRYFEWPAGQDNVIERLARQRLLGRTDRRGLGGAAEQQGLLQMVRDFCDQSNALCMDCQFPVLLKTLLQPEEARRPTHSTGEPPNEDRKGKF